RAPDANKARGRFALTKLSVHPRLAQIRAAHADVFRRFNFCKSTFLNVHGFHLLCLMEHFEVISAIWRNETFSETMTLSVKNNFSLRLLLETLDCSRCGNYKTLYVVL